MTIHLPQDLESSIRSLVLGGRFASEDEAIAEAVRSFLRQEIAESPTPGQAAEAFRGSLGADPILGFMRDDVTLMDEIVADAYRQRRDESWRELELE
jgi:Arc/MetJ-type ribon-helix-helix transcriptional regulator